MAKINWEKLEVEYITTKTSYAKLAKKHNISKSSIEKYATANSWQKKRRQYCGEVVANSLTRACARDTDRLTKMQEATEKMSEVIEEVFADDKQFRRQIMTVTDKDGNLQQTVKLTKKYDSKAIREMVMAVKDLSATIRNIYEIYTENEMQKMVMAYEKMAAENEKLDIVKEKASLLNPIEEGGVIEIIQAELDPAESVEDE